ncbi:MAG: SdrD B-like domain-containing protein [Acidimicrobiales bacterium]
MSIRQFLGGLLATLMVATVVVVVDPVPTWAASQNELAVRVTYDGTTPYDTDPVDDTGSYPSPHTPGLDARKNNGVVRTYDTFGVRMDFNINEASATNAVIQATLPTGLSWVPAKQTNPPNPAVPGGCLTEADGIDPAKASYISGDGLTLYCNTGDHAEGTNLALNFDVLVGGLRDGDSISLTAGLTTDEDPIGITETVSPPLQVSAAPSGNWVKGVPEQIAAANGGVPGTILIYPLTFTWTTGTRGSEPINTAADIVFYDHAWDLPPSAVPAPASIMPSGRTWCGQYDGAQPHPTNGTWTCTDVTGGAAYDIVELTVGAGYNAGNPDEVTLYGQVAFWVSQADLTARWALTEPENTIYNSITGAVDDTISIDKTATPAEDPATMITPIGVHGTSITVPEDPADNTSVISNTTPPTGGGGGGGATYVARVISNSVDIIPGAYRQLVFPADGDSGRTYTSFDGRQAGLGGLLASDYSPTYRDTQATYPISRDEVFTIHGTWGVEGNEGDTRTDPFHGCLALDTRHYELVPFGSITQATMTDEDHVPWFWYDDPASITSTISSSDGAYAHVLTGTDSFTKGSTLATQFWPMSGAVTGDPLPYVVEFGLGNPIYNGAQNFTIAEDTVTCNDGDATQWVDARTASDAQVAAATRVRVRRTTSYPWKGAVDNRLDSGWRTYHYDPGPSVSLFLQARVKSDLNVQTEGSELFVWASRGIGAWTGGAPGGVAYRNLDHLAAYPTGDSCVILEEATTAEYWTDDGNTGYTTTGWCNEPYIDSGLPSAFSMASAGLRNYAGRGWEFHADKRYIAVAKPLIQKQNWDPATDSPLAIDYADNGDTAAFRLVPTVTGASGEALTDVGFIDDLTTTKYEFVRYLQLPSAAKGYSCTDEATAVATNIVECQFSEPDPATDTGPLAAGLPGGWDDPDAVVIIEVRLAGGVATTPPTYNPNTVTISSAGVGPWDGTGFSNTPAPAPQTATAVAGTYMPNPWSSSAIVKAVPTQEGPCVLHPTDDPPPTGWGDRCQMIDLNGNMSFDLSIENLGNTTLNQIRFVDVFPHLADATEPVSNTGTQGITDPTTGDGRTPPTDYTPTATLGFVSLTGPDTTQVWVTGDPATSVSRDPDAALAATTWCANVGDTTPQTGSGTCPQTAEDVTATYSTWSGSLLPGRSYTQTLTLDSQGAACDDIWTNTFGSRAAQLGLPIRSNDVSIMVDCQYDLALRKTVDPAWSPGADWLTPGTSTVDYLLEVVNQGDPVEDFDVTEYIDPAVFSFDAARNTATATTSAGVVLPFSWDLTDPAKPVAMVDGALGTGQSVFIPVALTTSAAYAGGRLTNEAEISRFDSDGNPANGDSDPTNPANPSTGPLLDADSTPDALNTEAADGYQVDDVIDNTGGDEDDQDLAVLPVWDLELVKTARTPGPDTTVTPWQATFDLVVANQGTEPVHLVEVTEYAPPGLTFNPAATTALWTAEGVSGVSAADPVFTVTGPIAPGTTVSFPVVYDITDATRAPFRNAAEISAFDVDADPDNDPDPLAVDVDSTPDALDDDAVIDRTAPGNDPDNDGNLNEATPGDEDDHDIAELTFYDLALRKRVDPMSADLADGIQEGDKITFTLEVFNQAARIEDLDVTDYLDAGWVFDPLDNTAGTTSGDVALPYAWDSTSLTQPVAQVTGALPAGATLIIPIVLTVDVTSEAVLANSAEISRFDNDGDPANGDSDPANPNNPGGVALVDVDSTPDGVNGEPGAGALVDDVIDNSSGDEDDHDIALTQWFDAALIKTTASYEMDVATSPLTVTYDLTVKNQGPTELRSVTVVDTPPAGFTQTAVNGPGELSSPSPGRFVIDPLAPGAVVTFSVTYTIDRDLVRNPAVNTAEIAEMYAAFDPDGPNGPIPAGLNPAPDIDSTPDTDPDNDLVAPGDPDNPGAGVDVDAPLDSHNTIDFDGDRDGNVHDADGIDEDDHDTEALNFRYDLALTKTVASFDQPLLPDGTVTMLLTVINQGTPVATVEVTDYVDPAVWSGFDPSLNPAGTAGGSAGAAFAYTWDGTDPDRPVATLTPQVDGQRLLYGETLTVPVTLRVNAALDTSAPLVNTAEISNFDDDQDPGNGDAADGTLTDRDSTPDAINGSNAGETIGDQLVDDAIDSPTDEDDHDPAFIPVYDLALRKRVDTVATPMPVGYGDRVTFLIEVINQGTTDATDVQLVDTVDTTRWEAFDPAVNPDGTTTGDVALGYAWTAAAPGGAVTISGTLPAGSTAVVPVTLIIAADADLATLVNTAEITGGTPTRNGVTVTEPSTGDPIVDIDSTPDAVDDDPVVDDTVDGTGGDEDDHDIARVEPPTFSLGNQVWHDDDNDGVVDPGEPPIPGVTVELFTDEDHDGLPDDRNHDGVIDSADAVATTVTDGDGGYLFSGLAAGDYVVGIGPGNFATGGPLEHKISSTATATDPGDGVDNDDNGDHDRASQYVFSGPITLNGHSPTGESGLANDPDGRDGHSDLTVDFGFWTPRFDLALRKRVIGTRTVYDLGDQVTYSIEVFNQGNVTATDIVVTDTPPSGLRIDDPGWTVAADGSATRTIPGPLEPGESTVVTVTTTLVGSGRLENAAEITTATPLGPDGRLLIDAFGRQFPDIDTYSGAGPDGPGFVDDDIDGTDGDEDQSDIAVITVRAPALARTGMNLFQAVGSAIVAVLGGLVLVTTGRWRRHRRRPA